MGNQEIIVSFQRIGAIVRVTATDPLTGLEAVIQGPASSPQALLARTAVSKLQFMMRKRATEREDGAL